MNELIYLAAPYSDSRKYIRQARYESVTSVTAAILKEGYHVFSPITAFHMLDLTHGPLPPEIYYQVDINILTRCDRLFVLMIDGWDKSSGVAKEIKIAEKKRIPAFYYPPEDFYGEDQLWKF